MVITSKMIEFVIECFCLYYSENINTCFIHIILIKAVRFKFARDYKVTSTDKVKAWP